MAIPIFNNVPSVTYANRGQLAAAIAGVYGQNPNMRQRHYEEDTNSRCLSTVADSIIGFAENIHGNQNRTNRLSHGAHVGTLTAAAAPGVPATSIILLHATWTGHGNGNCSLICGYDTTAQTISLHAIGAHRGNYRYDGVSAALDNFLTQNANARPARGWRYTDAQHDTVTC